MDLFLLVKYCALVCTLVEVQRKRNHSFTLHTAAAVSEDLRQGMLFISQFPPSSIYTCSSPNRQEAAACACLPALQNKTKGVVLFYFRKH